MCRCPAGMVAGASARSAPPTRANSFLLSLSGQMGLSLLPLYRSVRPGASMVFFPTGPRSMLLSDLPTRMVLQNGSAVAGHHAIEEPQHTLAFSVFPRCCGALLHSITCSKAAHLPHSKLVPLNCSNGMCCRVVGGMLTPSDVNCVGIGFLSLLRLVVLCSFPHGWWH